MQSMHGVPFPVYRGFELLAAAGSHRIPVIINQEAPNLTATDDAVALMATVGNLNESSLMLGSGEAAVLRVFLSNFVPDAAPSSCIDKPQPCTTHPDRTFCATNYSADQCEHAPAPCPPCPPSPPFSSNGVAPRTDTQLKLVRSASGPAKDWNVYNTSRKVRLEIKDGTPTGGGKREVAAATSDGDLLGHVVLRVINSTCSNAKDVWIKTMASVTWPSATQLETLMAASKYCEHVVPITWSSDGRVSLDMELEAYAAISATFTREIQ